MTRYTARFLDRKKITIRECEFRCTSLEDAIRGVSSLAYHYALELWEDGRIVWTFDPLEPVKTVETVVGTRIKARSSARGSTRAARQGFPTRERGGAAQPAVSASVN